MKLIVSVLCLLLSLSIFAEVQPVLRVTSDLDINFTLSLDLNDEGIITHLINKQDEKPAEIFPASEFSDGLVLFRKSGKKISILSSTSDFTVDRGGHIILSFLTNALLKKRRFVEFDLQKVENRWIAFYEGNEILTLRFISRKLGIKHLLINGVKVKGAKLK